MARRKNCASSFSLAIEEPTLELTEAKAKRSPALAGRANLLVFGFALIALCLEGVAALPAVKLTGIRVLGSKRFTEASVVRASGLRVGAPASPKSFRDAANQLAASGAFADVRYQYRTGAAGYAVQFRVADAKVFFPCSFENFVWFSDKELQSRLSSLVPLFTGEAPPTGSLPGQVEAALGTLLKERGIQGTIHHTMFGQEGGPPEAILFGFRESPPRLGTKWPRAAHPLGQTWCGGSCPEFRAPSVGSQGRLRPGPADCRWGAPRR